MAPRNLLLCFDAFGTLFRPRQPVAQQYADVARKWGLGGFSNADVARSFKEAFKRETARHPNYGKAEGLGAEKWWTNIIYNTFQPLVGHDARIMSDVAPELVQRFWCDKGYMLFDDVQPLIRRLRDAHEANSSKVVVGVITNSDDRVPDILSSLGMSVSPLRYGGSANETTAPGSNGVDDIDFSVMSYDVGHEKPHKRIFDATEELLIESIQRGRNAEEKPYDPEEWRRVFVGDHYDKDIVGAVEAGWNAVLIDRETTRGRKEVYWLDPKPPGDLDVAFKTVKAVGFGSLAKLAEWLPSKP